MPDGERLILVHGLWMYPVMMTLMQHRLERCGYLVESWAYQSVRVSLRENAARLAEYCSRHDAQRLHLAGHSLGGLIALNAAATKRIPRLGRVVMLGTPFAGSFSARCLERLPGGRWMLGECMSEWLREPRPDAADGLDVGVVAGDGGIGLGRLIAPELPLPNDGVIHVDETRVPGMRDHIVLNVSHTEMIASAPVARQVCAFLKDGRFERPERAAA